MHGCLGPTLSLVRTLTVEEATTSLARWLELAVAGEDIRIRKGNALVELRLVTENNDGPAQRVSPREALRQLQAEARLTAEQAQDYLDDLHEERLALPAVS